MLPVSKSRAGAQCGGNALIAMNPLIFFENCQGGVTFVCRSVLPPRHTTGS